MEKISCSLNKEFVSLIFRYPCGRGKFSQVTIEGEEDVRNMIQTMVNIFGPNTNEILFKIIMEKGACNYYDPLTVEESQFLGDDNNYNAETGTFIKMCIADDKPIYAWFENDHSDANIPYATTNLEEEKDKEEEWNYFQQYGQQVALIDPIEESSLNFYAENWASDGANKSFSRLLKVGMI